MTSPLRKRYIAAAVMATHDIYQRAVVPGTKSLDRELTMEMPMSKPEREMSIAYLQHELTDLKELMAISENYPEGALPEDDRTRAGHMRNLVSTMCLYLQATIAHKLDNRIGVRGLSKEGMQCMQIFFATIADLSNHSLFHRYDHRGQLFNMDSLAECGVKQVLSAFAKSVAPEFLGQTFNHRGVPHLPTGAGVVFPIQMHRRIKPGE